MGVKGSNATRSGRPPTIEGLARERLVEVLMIRGTPERVIYRFAFQKWGTEPRQVREIMQRVKVRWKKQAEDPDQKTHLKMAAIRSLEMAREKCHRIINDKAGEWSKAQKLTAIGRLAAIERELARIGGYDSLANRQEYDADDVEEAEAKEEAPAPEPKVVRTVPPKLTGGRLVAAEMALGGQLRRTILDEMEGEECGQAPADEEGSDD